MEESAMLVGMLKNSSLYNPIRRPELVISRRNIVFQQMLRNEMLTSKVDSLQQLPLQIRFNPQSHQKDLQHILGHTFVNLCLNWIQDNPKADGEKYNLYLDGLTIYA